MLRTVVGAIQHYDWGDTTALPRLLGVPANSLPWAEIWFGTHHVAPSHLDEKNGPLLSSVAGEMTMLVKLLACSQTLSLQTHPTVRQAQDGFAREESLGIPLTSPQRMYKDASDKPEMLIALEPFEALCGFAPLPSSIALLLSMGWEAEAEVLRTQGIAGYLAWAFEQLSAPNLAQAPQWLQNISQLHPLDPGVRIAPLLNYIVLQPGEALALPAGNLHAYLRGTALEIMKSSDNVVRAAFTTKHVDVSELLKIVDTEVLADPIARPTADGATLRYPSPSTAFSVEAVNSAHTRQLVACQQHRIIFGMFADAPSIKFLAAGDSADIPSDAGIFWVCTQN